jgi:glycosyltransferase involved in cell wall biosynthesis
VVSIQSRPPTGTAFRKRTKQRWGLTGGVAALIPAYEAAHSVGDVITGVAPLVDEVVVVDDGSRDETSACARDRGATVVRHPSNRGKGAALKTGFAVCHTKGFAWILTLDADGQHEPAEASRFLAAAAGGAADIIVGTRMAAPEGMPLVRVATNRFTSFVVSCLAGSLIPDSQCGYRILSTQVLTRVPLTCSAYDLETELLVKAARHGYRVGWVRISSRYGAPRSYIRPVRDGVKFAALATRLAVGA